MKRFRKLIVPLDLDDSDLPVLGMTSRIAAWAEPEEIIFCHYNPKVQIPPSLREDHPWLFEKLDKDALEKMEQAVYTQAKIPVTTRCSFHLDSGNPILGTLAKILEHDCDLVVVGSMRPNPAVRLARKATCSVCIVPPESKTQVLKPLVAVDFSDHSRHACDIAFALADASYSLPPTILHIYQSLPSDPWATFPMEEIIAANESYARIAMDSFRLGLGRPKESATAHIISHESTASGILEHATAHGYDCILAGCRGKDSMSPLLLGTTIEEIITRTTVPVIAVKSKGTGHDFVEELLGMHG